MKKDKQATKSNTAPRQLGVDALSQVRGGELVARGYDPTKKKEIVF